MIQIKKLGDCCGCEACANVCPRECIHMEARDGFYYPVVESKLCVNCGLCEKICPENAPVMVRKDFEKKGIVARIKDDAARYQSTSGGAAHILTKRIVSDGGVAYGVAFDAQFGTVFTRVDQIENISALQGSKYPQCRINDGFLKVRRDLNDGKRVIVFGTPCQIQGLSCFLGKKYDDLILVDLICHGVPSPIIWKNYLDELFPQEQIQKVVFKHKKNGWKRWCVFIQSDCNTYTRERTEDLYMSSYLSGLNVRPSCFSCHFKGDNRAADITIADAWGTPEKNHILNDGKGLSSLIVHTRKGADLVKLVESEMIFETYSIEALTSGNRAYDTCILPNVLRNRFFRELNRKDILLVLQKYSLTTFCGKLSMKITGLLHKRGK